MVGSKFEGVFGTKKHTVADVREDAPRRVGRPLGKASNPEYERLTVLVKKTTRKTAERRWEDMEPKRDMSELLQKLLEEWLATTE